MANLKLSYQYVVTEEGLRKLIGTQWPEQLVKDYLANKNTAQQFVDAINKNTTDIATINGQIATINGQIVVINGQITTLTTNLNNHVAAQSAHGATGDIVGTNDYCTAAVGGTVLLASAVANAAPVSTTPPAIVATAGATYSQPYTQTQTDTINALRQNVIDLVAANNALVSAVNQMLATERTAKQRAT